MKKSLFGVILLSCLALLSCKKDKNGAVDLTDLALNCEELVMAVGDKYQLVTTLTPADAAIELTWESSKESVVSVANGEIKALKAGTAKVTVSYGTLSAKCVIEVCDKPKVGDYLYANGTWGKDVKDGKTVGVIFYAADPTKDDPTLKADHPNCTHGVAASVFTATFLVYHEKCDDWNVAMGAPSSSQQAPDRKSTINGWAGTHGFVDGYIGYSTTTHAYSHVLTLGYNNTAAMRKFNKMSENSAWPINIVDSLDSYIARVKVSPTTSGWYIPSAGEYIIFLGGSKEALDGSNANVAAMNTAISAVTGAFPLDKPTEAKAINGIVPDMSWVATSTDVILNVDNNNSMINWWETIVQFYETKVDYGYDDSWRKYDDVTLQKILRPFIAF